MEKTRQRLSEPQQPETIVESSKKHIPPQEIRRPAGVTYLALGVLIISVVQLNRVLQTLRLWDFLSQWISFSPLYLLLTGAAWGITLLFLAGGLWIGKRWAPRAARVLVAAFLLYYWLDRLLVSSDPGAGTNTFFMAVLSVLALAATLGILAGKKAKAFFWRN